MFVIEVEKEGKSCVVEILVFPETLRDDGRKKSE
jgi:hypothetical protein